MLKLRSLAFFILKKRRADPSLDKAAFLAPSDYHDYLRDAEPAVLGSADGFEDAVGARPLSLDEIDLSQIQYGDVVAQMFEQGISYTAVSLAGPGPATAPPAASPDYFENYVATLGGGADQTRRDVESTMERMNEILSRQENVAHRVNGLVVGRVQSGKTRNYVGLMLKAAAEGWNTMIVLTSANTQLADQTESRIKADFERARADTHIRLELRSGSPDRPAQVRAGAGSFYWGVAMKEASNLRRILDWLHDNKDLVPFVHLLVIDDEADNATPDSGMNRSGTARRLAEGELEELGDAAADSTDFQPAAQWMRDVQAKLQRVQDDIEANRETPDTRKTSDLVSLLGISSTSVDDVVGRYRSFLGLDSPDVEQNVKNFFIGPDASALHRGDCFVRFLNTVLQIAQARSATNRRICELVGLASSGESIYDFARCAYLAYTATPYANILNERPGESPLYADFIQSLSVSPRYFGLDRIFGSDRSRTEPAMRIVRQIPEEEKRFALNPVQGIKDAEHNPRAVLKVSIGEDLHLECKSPAYSGWWDSLREAVAWSFCAAAARRLHRFSPNAGPAPSPKIEDRWTTMLVNISQLRKAHRLLREKISDYVKARCAGPAVDDFVAECQRVWDAFRAEFPKAEFDRLLNPAGPGDPASYGPIADYPPWSALEPHVRYFTDRWRDAENVHVIELNASGRTAKEAQDRYNQVGQFAGTLLEDHLWIVCGGNAISRGLTLHGLCASYFDRVRKTVAVDTMTQMGRWFGYRAGYELLPRIWMLPATIAEMKNTAVVESNMHESIAQNFAERNSPSDPDHYQAIYSWGRRLSGRDAAQVDVTRRLGTFATTTDLPALRENIVAVAQETEGFVAMMGAQAERPESEFPFFRNFPLWTGVGRSYVIDLLGRLCRFYPDRSRRTLDTLRRKIVESGSAGPKTWSFVIGQRFVGTGSQYRFRTYDGSLLEIRAGVSGKPNISDGAVRGVNVRNYLSFFAMIPARHLVLSDADCLQENAVPIARYIDSRRDPATHAYPPAIDAVLRDYPQPDTERKLVALAKRIEEEGGRTPMPPAIHDCLPEGLRNRSASDYRERVYARFRAETGRAPDPVLQAYLLTPPAGLETDGWPLVSWSFYWPELQPDDFHLVSIGF